MYTSYYTDQIGSSSDFSLKASKYKSVPKMVKRNFRDFSAFAAYSRKTYWQPIRKKSVDHTGSETQLQKTWLQKIIDVPLVI